MFHNENVVYLKIEQEQELENALLSDIADRSSIFFIFFSITSLLYGFQSADVLKQFEPSITLMSNIWPRLLFSTLPCILAAYIQKRLFTSSSKKILVWAIGYPIIFLFNCLIHAWPIIHNGNPESYIYFHAANMFSITLSFALVAPNTKYFLIHLCTLLVTFFIPLTVMLHKNSVLLNMFLSEFLLCLATSYAVSTFLFKLRKKFGLMKLNSVTPSNLSLVKALLKRFQVKRSTSYHNIRPTVLFYLWICVVLRILSSLMIKKLLRLL